VTRDVRSISLVVVGILVVVAAARCSGLAEGRRARDIAIADSAAAAAVHQVAQRRREAIAARRVYVSTITPNVEAAAAVDRTVHRTAHAVDVARAVRGSALAAAADSARALPELRLELLRSADAIADLSVQVVALVDTLALERAVAAARIDAAETVMAVDSSLVVAQDTLDVRRVNQLTTRDGPRRTWLARAWRSSCGAWLASAGAGLGAILGGPWGAVAAGGLGAATGQRTCR
jgi:hypothetical protein